MKVTIAPDFEHLAGVRALSDEESSQLEKNVLADANHERMPAVVIWQCNKMWLIVEGHNQHRLRTKHGLKIKYAKMEFADRQAALRYAYEAQFGRRNLSAGERATAAAEYAKLLQICSTADPLKQGISKRAAINQAAGKAGVAERTAWHADKVHEHGAKAIQEAVKEGEVTVSDAASIATLPKQEQVAALKQVTSGKAKTLKAAAEKDSAADLAKKNKTLAHSLRDKLARAICDYHAVKPNRVEKDRLVKLVQGVELW